MAAGGWYYVDGSARVGPVEAGEIYRLIGTGALGPETLVWRQGMAGWQRAADHFDFGPAPGASGPPPLPPSSAPPPSVPRSPAAQEPAGQATMTGVDGLYIHAPARGFGEAISVCFRRYFGFSGRASRSEYWFFVLFTMLLGLGTSLLDGLLFGVPASDDAAGPLNTVAGLAVFFPSLAVGWRRLHDIGRSGWWIGGFWLAMIGGVLLVLFSVGAAPLSPEALGNAMLLIGLLLVGMLIYFIVMLVFMCTRGDPGPNRYG